MIGLKVSIGLYLKWKDKKTSIRKAGGWRQSLTIKVLSSNSSTTKTKNSNRDGTAFTTGFMMQMPITKVQLGFLLSV